MDDENTSMKRPAFKMLAALLILLLGVVLFWRVPFRGWLVTKPAEVERPSSPPVSVLPSRPAEPLPGEMILQQYGDPSIRPEEDLHAVAHALGNLVLLIKGSDPFHIGANEEFAAALRGKNKAQMRFLRDDHPAFNAKGQLVDRWQTPLFFHAKAIDRIEIRSAGPDQKMWTADDLHRSADGSFLEGEALNPKSLNDVPGPGQGQAKP